MRTRFPGRTPPDQEEDHTFPRTCGSRHAAVCHGSGSSGPCPAAGHGLDAVRGQLRRSQVDLRQGGPPGQSQLCPVLALPPCPPSTQLPPGSQFMFIRRDGHKPPLTPTYDGPFCVISQSDKTVTVERGLETDIVSVDRCKAAQLEDGAPVQPPARRGRPPLTERPPPRPPSSSQPPVVQQPRPCSVPDPQPLRRPPAASQPPPVSPRRPQRAVGRPRRFQDFVSP